MPKKIDLTGQRFGRLLVQYRNGSTDKGLAVWHCVCDCGNECDKIGIYLRDGTCKSCGCYQRDNARNKRIRNNTYNLSGDYGIGYDINGKEFYFDLDKYDLIKDYCWRVREDNYVDAKLRDGSRKRILLHVLLYGKHCDHIGGYETRNDNRSQNIRIIDNEKYSFETYNNMNKPIQKNNTSGYPGVSWHSRDSKWIAYISIDNKKINLGSFINKDDAIKIRKEAEEKYFGSYSYDNSQLIYLENNIKEENN